MYSSLTRGSWRPYRLEEDEEISINATDFVAFGDFNDVKSKLHFKESKTSDKSFRYPLNTVRKFVPGRYKLSIIRGEKNWEKMAIFHLPKTCAIKIITRILLSPDFEQIVLHSSSTIKYNEWFQERYNDLQDDEDFIKDSKEDEIA